MADDAPRVDPDDEAVDDDNDDDEDGCSRHSRTDDSIPRHNDPIHDKELSHTHTLLAYSTTADSPRRR